ncbi:NnrU family protein [Caldichromatium japonicum]|uniref:NnrU family protein n=1 Tax=Caldichromatium japonicum TaxID=2699430 RepID=A0A6G7VEM2_9GAMM|nr:NnrU family protein [Caldichromatium japonicum]QIK38335.1 NnrU family protein [Caldichromatium japonicum]
MALLTLILGLALFLGTHSIPMARPELRARLIERLGVMGWQGIYSLISLIGFILIVHGYGAARLHSIPLYLPPVWLKHIALLLMLPVFPLLFAAYLPGRIQSTVKHPMLAAIKLWGAAHLLANGMLADVLLFGSFMLWAVADRLSFRRREPILVRGAPPGPANDGIAIIGGLALYLAFIFWLHRALIGVAPIA